MDKLQAWLRRDGWLVAVLALCVALCAVTGRSAPADDSPEARLAKVLSSMEGAGAVQVALFYQEDGATPCGVVVVADGADDIAVQLRLARAVTTLLHIDANAVEVFKRGGSP